MNYSTRTMVVPALKADIAKDLCKNIAGPSGDGMFLTPLSPINSNNITHFISAGQIQEQFADLLPLTVISVDIETGERTETTITGQLNLIHHLAQEAGLSYSLQEISDLLAVIDVTESDPHTRIATLGLKIFQAEEV